MKMRLFGILLILFCRNIKATGQETMVDAVSLSYLATLIKTAKENYPRVQIHTKEIGIAQNNLNKARLSWFDGLGIYYLYLPPTVAGGSVNPTASKSGDFQFGFSFNIGSLLQKPAVINAAKGSKEVVRLEKKEYELTIEAEVKERYYKYIQQIILLKQRTQLSLDAQTMLTSVRSKFEKGQEPFESFSKALVFLNLQNQEKINTETTLLIAKVHLEEILNKKLEEIQ